MDAVHEPVQRGLGGAVRRDARRELVLAGDGADEGGDGEEFGGLGWRGAEQGAEGLEEEEWRDAVDGEVLVQGGGGGLGDGSAGVGDAGIGDEDVEVGE